MWIKRDIEFSWVARPALPARILVGVRQCGKTSVLERMAPPHWPTIELDDLQLRSLAQRDPALLLEQFPLPAIIDEIQHAPALFVELKRRIDAMRRQRRRSESREPSSCANQPLAWATGSNQVLLDKAVKESLAGRASYHTLHTLSVAELHRAFGAISLPQLFSRGGWPELYVDPELNAVDYLNDYVRTYVERDVVLAGGIQKAGAFSTVLALLAGRSGQLFNASEVAKAAGVQVTTVQEWATLLERTHLFFRLHPFHSNRNKRLTKAPKIYALDVGLAARLQGWTETAPILRSPQAGHLFETLVLGEIVRTRDHGGYAWDISFWRTKDGEEIDFLIHASGGRTLALEAKLAVAGAQAAPFPKTAAREFPDCDTLVVVVAAGGEKRLLSRHCLQVPIAELSAFLQERLGGT